MATHRQDPPHYDPPRIHDTPPKHLAEPEVDDARVEG
jgi:hypothetical protein